MELEEKKYDALSNKKTLASEYKNMEQDREPYLTKAKEAARYTIPSLLKDKHNGSQVQTYEQPNQSIGADGYAPDAMAAVRFASAHFLNKK